jgi:IS1 family transposase
MSLPDPEPDDVLELDEMWSFVQSKANPRWLWVALNRRTRQVAAWVLGDRSEETCQRLWGQLPTAYRELTTVSDFWKAYRAVFVDDHLMADKSFGETAHVERFNNTVRQRLGRYVRKTLSFSKSDEMHEASTKVFMDQYNRWLATTF